MKLKILLALVLSCCGILAAAEPDDRNVPPSPCIAGTNYDDAANWAICESDKRNTEFDVFYVYPTLFADKNQKYMNWRDNPKLRAKTVGFAKAQTGIFGDKARVFAPFVRQLDYTSCLAELKPGRDWREPGGAGLDYHLGIMLGAEDTRAAFQHYLDHFNHGRPNILIGHSQGAMDIYLMMLKPQEVVAIKRGFVAAYLIGLPRLTANEIAADLAPRGIAPATGATDLGVIIVWNTQAPEIDNPRFTGNGTFCINPLNWRTDATPANKAENRGAFFYDYRNGKCRTVPNFCGARIDAERGALIVDLPVNGEYDAKGFMGKGVFHMNDIWFFAGNIRDNAELRVKKWKEKYDTAK